MSWLSNLGNTVEGWFGHKNSATTTPASLKTPQDFAKPINDQKTRLQNALQGSFKKGGSVKKTGVYRLHKGEEVIPKKKVDMAKKMGWNERRTAWYDKHPKARIKSEDIPW